MMGHNQMSPNGKLESAMKEVYSKTPRTVKKAGVKGDRKTAMLRAIAFSKARKEGAKLPKK